MGYCSAISVPTWAVLQRLFLRRSLDSGHQTAGLHVSHHCSRPVTEVIDPSTAVNPTMQLWIQSLHGGPIVYYSLSAKPHSYCKDVTMPGHWHGLASLPCFMFRL